jgi:hypothetical protein
MRSPAPGGRVPVGPAPTCSGSDPTADRVGPAGPGGRRGAARPITARPIDGEVQLEDVDPGLAEEAEWRPSVWRRRARAPRPRQVAGHGDPWGLEPGVGHGDVGVEARARGGHGVDGDLGVFGEAVERAVGRGALVDGREQLGVGGPEVDDPERCWPRRSRRAPAPAGRRSCRRPARRPVNEAGPGRGRTGVEPLVPVNAWPMSREPTNLAAPSDERPVGLVAGSRAGRGR